MLPSDEAPDIGAIVMDEWDALLCTYMQFSPASTLLQEVTAYVSTRIADRPDDIMIRSLTLVLCTELEHEIHSNFRRLH